MYYGFAAFLLVAFLSLNTLLAAQAPSFIARRDFANAVGPTSVAIADLNGDPANGYYGSPGHDRPWRWDVR
jgi:hypothetical protein